MNIFSNNCIGGFLYEMLNIGKYNHPLYWTGMKTLDFIKFTEDYEKIDLGDFTKIDYSESKFDGTFVCDQNRRRFNMPAIRLNNTDIQVRFGHESFENFDNMYSTRLSRYNKKDKTFFILSTWCVDYTDDMIYRFCADKNHYKILVIPNNKFNKSMNNEKLLIINSPKFIEDVLKDNIYIIKKFIYFGLYPT